MLNLSIRACCSSVRATFARTTPVPEFSVGLRVLCRRPAVLERFRARNLECGNGIV